MIRTGSSQQQKYRVMPHFAIPSIKHEPRFAAVIDNDGTTTDTRKPLFDGFIATCAKFGITGIDYDRLSRIYTGEDSFRELPRRAGVPEDLIDAFLFEWCKVNIPKFERRNPARLIPFVKKELSELTASNVPIIMVTAAPRSRVHPMLEQLGIGNFFSKVYVDVLDKSEALREIRREMQGSGLGLASFADMVSDWFDFRKAFGHLKPKDNVFFGAMMHRYSFSHPEVMLEHQHHPLFKVVQDVREISKLVLSNGNIS
jgi:phosphoglycolate phosphatase-like HAD superfamily hydrolase